MPNRALLVWLSASLVWPTACVTSSPPQDPAPTATPTQEVESEPGAVIVVEPPAASRSASSPTGIPVCDEYLALYASCEAYLEPEIMACARRFHRVEQASLVHLSGTPEAGTLPDTCRSVLDALRMDCPEQHRR